ncbi:MAG TPA: hypothetical protein VEV81_13700, partial [Pyrinomonadaceae bacterium]|nr:hypothetical protein [Pyrinomonadaceae bacterium]
MSQPEKGPPVVMCLASYFKGNDFIRQCRAEGAHVTLVTREKMLQEEWAFEALDRVVSVPDRAEVEDYIHASAEAAHHARPDVIVA